MKVIYEYNGATVTSEFTCTYANNGQRNNFSTTLLELACKAILEHIAVSDNVYNNRPKTIAPTVNDFVVTSVHSAVSDECAYGDCEMHITLFAKDVNAFKNNKKLASLENAVLCGFPTSAKIIDNNHNTIAEYEIDNAPDVMPDTPDDYGFHARVILFQTILKVI